MTPPRRHTARHCASVLVGLALVAANDRLDAQIVEQGTYDGLVQLVRTGQYDEAKSSGASLLDRAPDDVFVRARLMEAQLATGAYDEAIDLGRSAPQPDFLGYLTGQALQATGRLDEAAQAYRQAAASDGPWRLTGEVALAELMFSRGQTEEAMERFDSFVDVYNEARGNLSATDLVAVGRAVRYLGRNNPDYFQDALKAFDEAAQANPGWGEPRVRIGQLFLEKYDSPAAKEEFQVVLAENPNHPDALLGMAEAFVFDGSSQANDYFARVMEVNPRHVRARTEIAMQYLNSEDFASAREEVDEALAVDPEAPDALTALAGIQLLRDDQSGFAATRARVLERHPRYADFDTDLAELSVRTRRYREAVDRAAAAIALDSAAWEAWGIMGMNQMRLGEIETGRAALERAFAGDPYNPWFKNNLDLADTFSRFRIHETEHFELFLHESEADILATYLAPLAEEAYEKLAARYGVEPDVPVRAELYPSHADFSVRTLGEAGLGALGVSFGKVLVMDAPSARQLGDYNWGSVFWHELAHTFHLAASDNRVPRWFSEGLAVHEQRKARPGWGHQANVPFLLALRDGRLKPVSQLNDGFMNPEYPEQVVFSYYQASLVFQLLEERHGFDVIRDMLFGYRDGGNTGELFESLVGMPIEEFDGVFEDYMQERFASPLAGLVPIAGQRPPSDDLDALDAFVRQHPGDLIGQLQFSIALYRARRFDEAERHLRRTLEIFPGYGGADSPLWFIALIQQERGELADAAHTLARLGSISESHYQAMLRESEVLEELGRTEESAAALQRAVQVWPYELELHERLADLHGELGNAEGAAIERAAVVALDPVDRAEALYQLAVAQHRAGDLEGARRSIMGALEVAPNYDAALEFLLMLRGTGS